MKLLTKKNREVKEQNKVISDKTKENLELKKMLFVMKNKLKEMTS